MPKFNPEKLNTFIQTHRGLTSVDVSRILALKKENSEKEKLLKEQEEKMGLVPESQPLVGRFALLENKYEQIRTSLKDADLKRNLEERVAEIKNEFKNIPANVTKESLEGLTTKLTNFDMLLNVAEATIRPPMQEPVDVLGLWPSNISKRDDKQHKGWVYDEKGKQENLPTADWDKADANIRPVFADYRTFMLDGNEKTRARKVEILKPLIDAKNNVVEALKAKDPIRARALAEELKSLLAEKKESWNKSVSSFNAVEGLQKEFQGAQDNAARLPATTRVELEADEKALKALLQKAQRVLTAGNNLSDEDIAEITRTIGNYNKRISYYEQNKYIPINADSTAKHAAINGVWNTDPRTGERKLVGFLNDIPTDASRMKKKEKDRMITPVGRPEMRMEDYVKEQAAKRAAESQVAITDDLLDEWPELASAGHHAGDPISKEALGKFQTRVVYERLFGRDQNGFLSRYTIPTLDPKTNTVRYTESKLLKSQGSLRNVIKDVLKDRGIVVEHQNDEERKAEEQGKQLWRKKHSTTFHPRLIKTKTLFAKADDGLRVGGLTNKELKTGGEINETLLSEKERFEKLKRQREKYLGDAVNYRFEDKEKELGERLKKAQAKQEALGDAKNWSTKNDLRGIQKEVKKYEADTSPLIEKQKEERRLPSTPEERQKRQEALAKIQGIMNAYKKWNIAPKKSAQISPNQRLSWLVFSLILATGGGALFKQQMDAAKEASVAAAQPAIEAKAQAPEKKKWEDYIADKKTMPSDIFAKKMGELNDFRSMSLEDFAAKYANLIVKPGNPSTIRDFLTLDGYKLLHEEGYRGLTEEQQRQASEVLMFIQTISQAVDAPKQEEAYLKGFVMAPSQDWYTTPNVSLNSYFEMIQKKARAASA